MLRSSICGVMVNHQCGLYIGWSRYTAVETVLWLGVWTSLTTRLLPQLREYRLVVRRVGALTVEADLWLGVCELP